MTVSSSLNKNTWLSSSVLIEWLEYILNWLTCAIHQSSVDDIHDQTDNLQVIMTVDTGIITPSLPQDGPVEDGRGTHLTSWGGATWNVTVICGCLRVSCHVHVDGHLHPAKVYNAHAVTRVNMTPNMELQESLEEINSFIKLTCKFRLLRLWEYMQGSPYIYISVCLTLHTFM